MWITSPLAARFCGYVDNSQHLALACVDNFVESFVEKLWITLLIVACFVEMWITFGFLARLCG
jgi:hypothetical protein